MEAGTAVVDPVVDASPTGVSAVEAEEENSVLFSLVVLEPVDPEGEFVALITADTLDRLNASTATVVLAVSFPVVTALLVGSDEGLAAVVAESASRVVSSVPVAFVVLAVGAVVVAEDVFSFSSWLSLLSPLFTSLA